MIRVQCEDFDPGAELRDFGADDPRIGAVVSFTGLVRAHDGGADSPAITAMTLEHYPGMTEGQLAHIAEGATRRFSLCDALIIHRHGRLEVGARIVFVAAAASHRRAAFEACDFMMDFLKTRAPFWKREETADGQSAWVDARMADDAAAGRWS